jgi:hypothetical protein
VQFVIESTDMPLDQKELANAVTEMLDYMTRLPLALAVMVVVSACNASDTPQDARGETPVRYVICSVGDTDCFVAARFKDFSSCESHRKWAEMLCDSISRAGKMSCRKDPEPSIGVAYCTK